MTTGLEHYPAGADAFDMAPPRGTDKPIKPTKKPPMAIPSRDVLAHDTKPVTGMAGHAFRTALSAFSHSSSASLPFARSVAPIGSIDMSHTSQLMGVSNEANSNS